MLSHSDPVHWDVSTETKQEEAALSWGRPLHSEDRPGSLSGNKVSEGAQLVALISEIKEEENSSSEVSAECLQPLN